MRLPWKDSVQGCLDRAESSWHAWEKQCAMPAAARTSPINTLLASLRMTSSQPGTAAMLRTALQQP